jgi:parvulin-like peptidyl-prolyl isomerase
MMGKRAHSRKANRTASRLRNWRVIAVAAAVAVIAVVVVVLLTLGATDDELVATVNGEEITAGHVAQMQARHEFYYGEQYSFEEALERLVVEALIYQEAQRAGYLPDLEQAEQELGAQLARDEWTMEELMVALEESGIAYDDYMETFRKELAIKNYVDDEVTVTTEQARDRYDYLVGTYEGEVPPFESVKEQIVFEMESENLALLIERLRADATIEILVEGN